MTQTCTEPILITEDDDLADEVARLAAVAGRQLRRITDSPLDGENWRCAELVVLDANAADAAVSAGHPRRAGVVVVCTKPPPGFWRCAFEIGADQAITLPDGETTLVEVLSEDAGRIAARGRVLAIVGGCGGAGASLLAAATALASAQRGDHCLLLDCDLYGGGLDLALGLEERPGLRWSGLTVTGGRVSGPALHQALPARENGSGELALLACDRDVSSAGLTSHALSAVIDAGRRAGDTVICDLPRADTGAAAAGFRQADLTIVVVPAEVRACAAAARVVASLRDTASRTYAVVRGPAPGGLRAADVGRVTGLEVLGTMRYQPCLAAEVDRGGLSAAKAATRGPLAHCARDVLAALDEVDSDLRSLAGAS